MRREARKLFNRLEKYNRDATEYPRLSTDVRAGSFFEPEGPWQDGGHYFPLMWKYKTGKYYSTINERWDPYADGGRPLLQKMVEARVN